MNLITLTHKQFISDIRPARGFSTDVNYLIKEGVNQDRAIILAGLKNGWTTKEILETLTNKNQHLAEKYTALIQQILAEIDYINS